MHFSAISKLADAGVPSYNKSQGIGDDGKLVRGQKMTFADRALPLASLGIPVIPVLPHDKKTILSDWQSLATIDPEQIAEWNKQDPQFNVGLVARAIVGEVCFLEFDVRGGMKAAAEEMGQSVPKTRVHKSGSGYAHFIFTHTERSVALGNRQANKDGHEWYSFRADRRYVVGAGSIHPNGNLYTVHDNAAIAPVPDWICDWIERHSVSDKTRRPSGSVHVHEDFDLWDFLDFFDLSITDDEPWYIPSECPVAGHKHQHSGRTGFYFDGQVFGWHCFAQNCDGSAMNIGDVIKFLNEQEGETYKGAIWSAALEDEFELDCEDLFDGLDVDVCEEPARPKYEVVEFYGFGADGENLPAPASEMPAELEIETKTVAAEPVDAIPADVCDLIEEREAYPALIERAFEQPTHFDVDTFDPRALYGKLGKIARTLPNQLGYVWPALLAAASVKVPVDDYAKVRANIFVALLGKTGQGKTFAIESATEHGVFLNMYGEMAEGTTTVPGSDRGMERMLDLNGRPYLLVVDEGKKLMAKCNIQNSALPYIFNELFSKDISGGKVKDGNGECHVRLSLLMNVTLRTASEFSKVFGSQTVDGFADRFIYGVAPDQDEYMPLEWKPNTYNMQPCRVPYSIWQAKAAWLKAVPDRTHRLGELLLRVALIQSSFNGDAAMNSESFQAAAYFMEMQERIREVYKSGLAENKDAECLEAIVGAIKEHVKQQVASGIPDPNCPVEVPEKSRLRAFKLSSILHAKNFYRTYATVIPRVKKMMAEEKLLNQFMCQETDAKGEMKDTKRGTGFYILTNAF